MKMKMEGLLPLHLCHSQYASLYPLRFLFLVFTISITCLASSSRACPGFTCGHFHFPYPFGEVNSGCGDPALQLECDREVNMALINISGYQYYLWDVPELWKERQLKIIEKKSWTEGCNPLVRKHTTEILSSSLRFNITDDYRNLTLWEGCPPETIEDKLVYPLQCNHSWYVNLTADLSFCSKCKSNVTFPVSEEGLEIAELEEILHTGFRIQLKPNEICTDCEDKGGLCGYDINSRTETTEIYCHGSKSKSQTLKIVLGGVIGTVALLLMGALLLFLNRKRCLPTYSQNPDLSNVERFLQDYVHQMPCRYSYPQLMKITNNFAHKVGEGGFGVVYKGKLSTGDLVAVKILDQSRRCENQFMNEVATIGRIHHVHLVRLMGYCFEEHRNALVYEYMANGSLDNFIFAGREKEQILNWAQLYSIALGAARGIAYLHQDCDNRIIHFDIKPHNILLDEEFTPKVADFGLAKLCGKKEDHISMTAARGTPGYAAPEVWNRNLGHVTEKSDVYSIGMVLLEIVGGRKNVDVQASRSSQLYFPEWAFKLMENGQLQRELRGSGKAEIECEEKEKAIRLAKVGLWCIQYNSRDRPSMSRVVQMLEGNGDDVSNPPLPFNSTIRAALSIHSSEESYV
ncbi:hypothetical protein SUGI_0116080 [Cryptomeria japonica]|uniref:LEAF RUST 10 DISEASE-RESISTANCE LOCUS RECEPTOR-LIKE PROTEIN KINASE-like 2.3 n=1 Tax=Cryptomeria japonica TaxID=3369 RepID=UPI002408A475|nr:LEAF RUST 10 DISEASE-RESISTANCE LOCUS RECEPTOR-LIKE PROTEIN KINASE-like 2.3 [Cryptomeria japonica]GLJ09797.1 hypothetical protein SUGI_0116080 [Cryptomeria japonica]